jgi:hypothetical protein
MLISTAMLVALAIQAGPLDDPALDAVKAAPANHEVVFENAHVRVLRVTVAPGETEPPHVHRWPSVFHIEQAQPLTDILYRREADGSLTEVERRALPDGPPPPALWFPPEGPHSIHNGGAGTFKALRIEMKDAE